MPRPARIPMAFATVAACFTMSCGPLVTEPMPDIPQTVEYETVRIEYGTGDGLQEMNNAHLQRTMIVGDSSELAAFTLQTVAGTNRILYDHFQLIDNIKVHPPSSHEDGVWNWEAHLESGYFHFRIEEQDTDTYTYSLRGGRSSQDNREYFSGRFTAFEHLGDRQQGFGTVRFDFDAIRHYDASSQAWGKVAIAFRANNGVRQVRVGFDQALFDAGNEPLNALYEYVQFPNQRGHLIFFGRADFTGDGVQEFLGVNANWTADRAGRVAGEVSGAALAQPIRVEQCWNEQSIVVYAHSTPTLPDYDGGEFSDCAAELQDLEIEPPLYDPPDGEEPEVPGPHPAE
ncbi:MAG: hypothetical protein ACNA8W_10015 [Bradymonadaceae bacterium]